MKNVDNRDQQIEALRNRLSKLSKASLRINDSLDLDTVLQEILDSARSLTDARYGVILTLDDKEQVEDFLASGLTNEETQQLLAMPEGPKIFEYLTTIPGPLRVPDFARYLKSQGLSEFRPPTGISASASLGAPIRHRGEHVGHIYLAKLHRQTLLADGVGSEGQSSPTQAGGSASGRAVDTLRAGRPDH